MLYSLEHILCAPANRALYICKGFTLFFMGTVVRTFRKQVLQLRKLGLLKLRKLDV